MKKVIKLTEADLARIVKRVIKENEEDETDTNFNFTQTDNKLLSDFFTVKNNFNYVGNKEGLELYSLKRRGFALLVGTKPSNEPSNIILYVYLKFPMGKSINYLEEVQGRNSIEIPINDYSGMSKTLQAALDFGKAQSDYDNMEPLPR